jgi:predicted DNA-binding transcriptional regulator AlpA
MTTTPTDSKEPQLRLITTAEAAACLSVSDHWLKASRFRPELDGPPFVRIGRSVRYDMRDLEAWITRRKFRGTHETFSPME